MKKIKLGIIGVGLAYQKLHLPALKRLENIFEIVALCDVDAQKLKKAAVEIKLCESKTYSSYKTMLEDSNIEAVLTLVPIDVNKEVAKAVIDANKHLLAEKPLAATLEGGLELLTIIKESKSKILIGENFRYDEENNIIKKIIEEKSLGEVMYFVDNNTTNFPQSMLQKDSFASTKWRQNPSFEGGIFLDGAVHHMARLRYFFGDVKKIVAMGKKSNKPFCEYSKINAIISFDNEVSGHYGYFNMGDELQKPVIGLRIFFTEGEIFLEDREHGYINIIKKSGDTEVVPYKAYEGYYNELNNFYKAIVNNEEIVYTAEEEFKDMEMIFKILESIKSGLPA
jgi:predicted dehydrogenase